jgi:hypothetical protein
VSRSRSSGLLRAEYYAAPSRTGNDRADQKRNFASRATVQPICSFSSRRSGRDEPERPGRLVFIEKLVEHGLDRCLDFAGSPIAQVVVLKFGFHDLDAGLLANAGVVPSIFRALAQSASPDAGSGYALSKAGDHAVACVPSDG